MLDPQMVQVRRDPLTGDTILMACDRAARPNDYQFVSKPQPVGDPHTCPFCPQNESATIEPRFDYPPPDPRGNGHRGQPWVTRVVPNLYPVIDPTIGFHRVIIESRRHVSTWSELTVDERTQAMAACQDQLNRAGQDGFPYAQVFKNCGPSAGASLSHVHSQIVASPRVPTRVATEVSGAVRYVRDKGRCFFCEQNRGAIAFESESFIAVCPYASRFPYETWVLPREHESHFQLSSEGLAELGEKLARLEGAYQRVIPDAAYNWLLHTAPAPGWTPASAPLNFTTGEIEAGYHWHIEIFPRIAKMAGYEFATDQYINIVDPHDAAEHLAGD